VLMSRKIFRELKKNLYMNNINVELTDSITAGDGYPMLLISGPCVIEGEEICMEIGTRLKKYCGELGLSFIFKASFDKANRTSICSFRGPGLERGLEILRNVKRELEVPVLTDIHEVTHIERVAESVDVLQIPAFLCRQTDVLVEAGKSGRAVNIKKGQFMAPADMQSAIEKVLTTGNKKVMLTERGTTFGYNNLIVDMRSLVIMRSLGVPVIFDATHSVQLPGGLGQSSGGQREFVSPLTRAATAVGVDGLFLETHPNPENAKSDGPNSIPLDEISNLLEQVVGIRKSVTT
jgi:2-dehydro-3-deoxyphosphooctonate aldolase (KDO 8-P synthase)